MRTATALFVSVGALAVGAGVAGCVTDPHDGSPKVQTTAEADRDGVTGVAESPLRDLNVLRTKIPAVLLQAMSDPYERPASGKCIDLVSRIVPLNDALG